MASDPIAYQHSARQDAHTARTEARPQSIAAPDSPALSLGKITAVGTNTYSVRPIASNGFESPNVYTQVPVVPRGGNYSVDDIVWLAKLGDTFVIVATGGGGSSTCAIGIDVFGPHFG